MEMPNLPVEQTQISRRLFFLLPLLPLLRRKRRVAIAGIRFRILRHGRSLRRYLHIHGDEKTARQVLIDHMKWARGIAYLIESEQRNVSILDGKIDPNRMFSTEGASRSLATLNPNWPPAKIAAALRLLDRDRPNFIRSIKPPQGGLLLCLHNNSPEYSVADEISVSDLASIANPDHPREFMLATDPRDFAILRRSAFNVVLQHSKPADDDGSLSRLSARIGFRYLNIESPHGAAAAQISMLSWAEDHLPARY